MHNKNNIELMNKKNINPKKKKRSEKLVIDFLKSKETLLKVKDKKVENLYEYYEEYYKKTSKYRVIAVLLVVLIMVCSFYIIFK